MCCAEDAFTDIFHLEIWLDGILIEFIMAVTDLLGIVCPVPRTDHGCAVFRKQSGLDILIHYQLHVGDLLFCLCHGRGEDAVKKLVHSHGIMRHLVRKDEISRSTVAEKLCLLYPELHYLYDHGIVVTGIALVASGGICIEHLFPEVAPCAVCHERDITRIVKGEQPWTAFGHGIRSGHLHGITGGNPG